MAAFLLKLCLKFNIERSERKKKRKCSVLGIKIISPWPIDPLVICHAKINSNCFHKGKEKFVWGGESPSFLYNND